MTEILLGEQTVRISIIVRRNMTNKNGYKTTEFWLSAVGVLLTALLALLVGYGIISTEQADLWLNLLVASAPIAAALIIMSYNNSRAKVKAASSFPLWAPADYIEDEEIKDEA